jgi:hypothetical protein
MHIHWIFLDYLYLVKKVKLGLMGLKPPPYKARPSSSASAVISRSVRGDLAEVTVNRLLCKQIADAANRRAPTEGLSIGFHRFCR